MASYSDSFRASAIAMLQSSGWPEKDGALSQTAKALNVPLTTLHRWASGKSNPPPSEIVTQKKEELSDLLDNEIRLALGAMSAARLKASYRDIGTVIGILVDKKQLLTGKPTWIVEITDLLREGKVTQEEVQEELGDDLATELFESIGLSASTSREAQA